MRGTYEFLAAALGLFGEPEEWQEQAVCTQVDPAIFYPDKGTPLDDARRVCAVCPVREECLQAALDRDERFGVFGGASVRQRIAMKRKAQQLPRLEPKPVDHRSEREARIVSLAGSGLSDIQIATRVGVSRRVVEQTLAGVTVGQDVTQAA